MRARLKNAEFARRAIFLVMRDFNGLICSRLADKSRERDRFARLQSLLQQRRQIQFTRRRSVKENGLRALPCRLPPQEIARAGRSLVTLRVRETLQGRPHSTPPFRLFRIGFLAHLRRASICARHFSNRSLIFFSAPSSVAS